MFYCISPRRNGDVVRGHKIQALVYILQNETPCLMRFLCDDGTLSQKLYLDCGYLNTTKFKKKLQNAMLWSFEEQNDL